MVRIASIVALCATVLAAAAGGTAAQVPAGYPAGYAALVAAAEKEGTVSVYAPTDPAQSQALMAAFRKAYPRIRVDWNDITAATLYSRVISEAAAKEVGGDVAFNVPDLQLKLVALKLTVPYDSPEAPNLPDWAKFQSSAYATTIEPAVIVYNKALTPPDRIPATHDDLLRLLQADTGTLRDKIATFDPEKSGQGFIWSRSNERLWPGFWPFVEAFGRAGGKVYSSSSQFRERILSGELLLGIDMNGAYGREWAKASPNLGIAFMTDYTQAWSRVAILLKDSPHPNAGKVFLDFMLSRAGQEAGSQAGLPSVRSDVTTGDNLTSIETLAGGHLHPIALSQTLIDDLDPKVRAQFLARWRATVKR